MHVWFIFYMQVNDEYHTNFSDNEKEVLKELFTYAHKQGKRFDEWYKDFRFKTSEIDKESIQKIIRHTGICPVKDNVFFVNIYLFERFLNKRGVTINKWICLSDFHGKIPVDNESIEIAKEYVHEVISDDRKWTIRKKNIPPRAFECAPNNTSELMSIHFTKWKFPCSCEVGEHVLIENNTDDDTQLTKEACLDNSFLDSNNNNGSTINQSNADDGAELMNEIHLPVSINELYDRINERRKLNPIDNSSEDISAKEMNELLNNSEQSIQNDSYPFNQESKLTNNNMKYCPLNQIINFNIFDEHFQYIEKLEENNNSWQFETEEQF